MGTLPDVVSWGALLAALGFGFRLVQISMLLQRALLKAETRANEAFERAEDGVKEALAARKRADDAIERLLVHTQAHAILREEVARQYVSRDILREVEDRLQSSIMAATAGMSTIHQRLDRVLEGVAALRHSETGSR